MELKETSITWTIFSSSVYWWWSCFVGDTAAASGAAAHDKSGINSIPPKLDCMTNVEWSPFHKLYPSLQNDISLATSPVFEDKCLLYFSFEIQDTEYNPFTIYSSHLISCQIFEKTLLSGLLRNRQAATPIYVAPEQLLSKYKFVGRNLHPKDLHYISSGDRHWNNIYFQFNSPSN